MSRKGRKRKTKNQGKTAKSERDQNLFVEYLSAKSGEYMEKTLEAYEINLTKFAKWLKEKDLNPLDVILRDLEAWRNQLSGGSSYKNQHIYTIRSFYKWCVAHSYIDASPAQALIAFSQGTKVDEIPTLEEVKKCLAEFKQPARILVAIQAMSGARMEGAMTLRISDIHKESREIILREKAKRNSKEKQQRTVKVPELLLSEIDSYLAVRPDASAPEFEDILILNRKENPYYTKTGVRWFQRYLKRETKRTCGKEFRSHSFRKFFGRDLFLNDQKVPTISKLLGHASIQTTMKYIQVSKEDMEKAIENGSSFRLEERAREEREQILSENEQLRKQLEETKELLKNALEGVQNQIEERLEALRTPQ
ncbi:MAG: tyrosine-type recombinase/integrase [Candidatus Heimdallarchaeota archaeon]